MINTFTLRNGVRVLAKENGDPYHFTNSTQAERRAATLRADGLNAFQYRSQVGRFFYVAIVGEESD